MADSDSKQATPANQIEKIVRENYDAVYRYCYWQIRSETDAQDITQETFERFIKSIDTYADLGKPRAMLYTISKNLCINWRKKAGFIAFDSLEDKKSSCSIDTEEATISRMDLSSAISSLSEIHQEVLLLRYGQELGIGEISEVLCISRFTVRYRLNCALARLKKSMKEG